ncbi:MAG TPA: nucleotidyltransferase domain-containing protein [Anaerolineae bacterium]|nr:nucleotidyltransferase domain-containing protein [Anaerolineae bacterium]
MTLHPLVHLAGRDQQAIKALIGRLMAQLGDHILHLTLFGSKARGEDTAESDIDVLVVTTDDTWPLRHRILLLGARLSLEHDVLFNLYVIGRERWAWMRQVGHPLYRNIIAHGVDLIPEVELAGEEWQRSAPRTDTGEVV